MTRQPRAFGEPGARFVSRSVRRAGILVLSVALATACGDDLGPTGPAADAHLTARPGVPTRTPAQGMSALGLEEGRDGLLFVPESYDPDTPVPLLVLLHGAGGQASDWISAFDAAGALGVAVLAVDSRGSTWDRIRGDFGPDVSFLDAALAETFAQVAVNPNRIALAGFSDGASYALSLGVGNGDLFTHLIAFSPGLINSGETLVGRPAIFVAHGTQDNVLSVSASRDQIVPLLQDAGYDVRYQEFEGGHVVLRSVFDDAMAWFLD